MPSHLGWPKPSLHNDGKMTRPAAPPCAEENSWAQSRHDPGRSARGQPRQAPDALYGWDRKCRQISRCSWLVVGRRSLAAGKRIWQSEPVNIRTPDLFHLLRHCICKLLHAFAGDRGNWIEIELVALCEFLQLRKLGLIRHVALRSYEDHRLRLELGSEALEFARNYLEVFYRIRTS